MGSLSLERCLMRPGESERARRSIVADDSYRVGIVGATGIGARYPDDPPPPFKNRVINSHVASLALVPRVEVVGVCDLAPELLDRFTESWSERWPNANTYTDYKQMLAAEKLDILAVATSEHRHADITVDGARAGVKGVFCEKPLATSMEDADRMIAACEENGVVLISGHTRRWRLLYHVVRDAVRAGAIGPLCTMVATLGGSRGMLFREGTHIIDAMCFLAESEPAQVFANVAEGYEDWDRYKGRGGKHPEDPALSGFILFRNGIRALYSGTRNSFLTVALQLSGPDGQIYFGLNDQAAKLLTRDPSTGDLVSRKLMPKQYQVFGLVAAYEELIDIIERSGPSVSPAREGRRTVQIMEGFLNSQQAGSRLVDVPA